MRPLLVKPGDRVPGSATVARRPAVKLGDQEYLVMREEDVFGVIGGRRVRRFLKAA